MRIGIRHSAAVAGCLVAGTIAAGVLVGAPQAHAATGHQPFAQDAATALVARPDASGAEQLYKKDLTADAAALVTVGDAWQGNGRTKQYNALGFSKTDGYVYAISGAYGEIGGHNLLQVGSDGSVVDLGPLVGDVPDVTDFVNNGTIVDGKHLLVSAFYGSKVWSVDLKTRVTTATTLDQAWRPADFVSLGDENVLWGVQADKAYRADLRTGRVSAFPFTPLNFKGGAVFAYPNGDIGLSADDGHLHRVRVTGADTDAPAFALVSTIDSPASEAGDGTAIQENADVFLPFDKNKPFGLWASSIPGGTQLHLVDPSQPEAPATALGAPWTGNGRVDSYNGIAYNKADGYVYAITGSFQQSDNRLVRIGRDGTVREVGRLQHATEGWFAGSFFNNGTIVDGKLLIAAHGFNWLISVDLATAKYTQIDLSEDWKSSDMTSNDGRFLWGVNGASFQRVEIATGRVTSFPNTILPSSIRVGGIMNGNDGDFIASSNDSSDGVVQGTVYRFHVTDPGSDNPGFRLVATGRGPVSGDNDGTSNVDAP